MIRLNRIGDALVTTALIQLLKDNLDCEIEILADRKNHFVFANNSCISKTIIFHKGLLGIFAARKYIAEAGFDVVVDTHDDVSTTVSYIAALAPVRFKFGLRKTNKVIFNKTEERLDGTHYHVIERILQIANLFGIKPNLKNANVIYSPKEASIQFAEVFINKNFNEKRFLIGINISAGSTARFWGIERFQKLLQYLSDKNVNVILISPPNDFELAKNISLERYPIFSESEFDKAAAIVSKVDLFFTPDTSFVHIASAFKVPMFGLYVKYNTTDIIWYPYKSKYDAVITDEPNLENITFDEVIKKFIPFFESLIINN